MTKRLHRFVKRAAPPAEIIVGRTDAVERDAYVGEAQRLDFVRRVGIDEGAVSRECEPEAAFARITRDIKKARVDERFTTREQNAWHLECGEVVNDTPALLQSQFAGILARLGIGVTVK